MQKSIDDVMAALENQMLNMPLCRHVVSAIDPVKTAVLVLERNLFKAIEHYSVYCNPLPEFRILDWGADHPGLAIIDNIKCMAQSAARKSDYVMKETCFFAPRIAPYYSDGSVISTFHAGQRLGIHELSPLDRVAIADFEDIFFIVPIPPDYYVSNREVIARCYYAMADDASRQVFAGALKARLTGNAGYIPFSNYLHYFHPQVQAASGDMLCEGGIETGKTTLYFSKIIGPTGRVYAFEPVVDFCNNLREVFSGSTNIILEPKGLWSSPTEKFILLAGEASRVQDGMAENTVACQLIDLDSYMDSCGSRCDMIKLDVEGSELEALRGSQRTLQKWQPKLAISIYHWPFTQFIEIIDFLLGLDLGYTFYLGHHSPMIAETVLYGLPAKAD